MTVETLAGWVQPLLNLGAEAGEAILAHYHAPDSDRYQDKGDDTPLTAADLAADEILKAGLAGLAPEIPILSEESPAGGRSEQREWERYWLVDPLDGTREFLDRTGDFTVNIALIEAHRPVLGVLYVPLGRYACVGIPGQGAWRYDRDAKADKNLSKRWRSEPIACRQLEAQRPLALLASHRHRSKRLQALLGWIESNWGQYERFNSGSALKFADLAQGEGDLYPRFSTCCEWDTAAGQAIVEAAGGAVLGMDGKPLRYNTRQSLYSPYFYAVADSTHSLWRALVAARLDEIGA